MRRVRRNSCLVSINDFHKPPLKQSILKLEQNREQNRKGAKPSFNERGNLCDHTKNCDSVDRD